MVHYYSAQHSTVRLSITLNYVPNLAAPMCVHSCCEVTTRSLIQLLVVITFSCTVLFPTVH